MDEKYIREAMNLALKAQGRTSPNPMVGAVIVNNGKIVGSGYHKAAGSPHAEVEALLEAGEKAKGATIYINLEPCSHYGKTPPCTKAIIKAGIKKVVISMLDPNPNICGVEELKDEGIEVDIGILEKDAKEINEVYLKYITTNLPFVTLKLAMTLDGKITLPEGGSTSGRCSTSGKGSISDKQWISGEESRLMVHHLRNQVDAIMVGSGTILVDDPLLTCRIKQGSTRDPLVVVVDSNLGIPLSSKIFQTPQRVIMATITTVSEEKRSAFEKLGIRILTTKGTTIDMNDLMVQLGQLSITSILIEGGSLVSAAALQAGIIDKIIFFIAPKIAGKRERDSVADLNKVIGIKDMSIKRIGEDILVVGYVEK